MQIGRLLGAVVVAAALAMPATANATDVPPTIIAGPSVSVAPDLDVDRAPDGSAAIAYLRVSAVDGPYDVYVSTLQGNTWSEPVRIDSPGLPGYAMNPQVAVSNGGRVVVTFLHGSDGGAGVYSAIKPDASSGFGPVIPIDETPIFQQVDVDANPSGVAYATFASERFNGGALWAVRLSGTTWQPVGGAPPADEGVLNHDPSHPVASTDRRGGAAVAVTDSGDAIVAWREETAPGSSDHEVYARRLRGTALAGIGPAVRASVSSLAGAPAAGDSGAVDVSVDGAGTGWVAFRQDFMYGALARARTLVRPLKGNAFSGAQVIDGLANPPGNDGATAPSVATNRAGQGVAVSRSDLKGDVWGTRLAGGTWTSPGFPVDAGKNPAPALDPTAAIGADSANGVIAWGADPGGGHPISVLARRTSAGGLSPTLVLSRQSIDGSPKPASVDDNLDSAADASGSTVVAFTQRVGIDTRAVVAAIVDPTAPPAPPAPPEAPPAPAGPAPDASPAPAGASPDGGASEPSSATTPAEVGWVVLAPVAVIAPVAMTVVDGETSVTVTNPNDFPVNTKVRITSTNRLKSLAAARRRSRGKIVTFGQANIRIPAKARRKLRVRIARRTLRHLRGKRRGVPVKITLSLRAPNGAIRTITRRSRLALARAR